MTPTALVRATASPASRRTSATTAVSTTTATVALIAGVMRRRSDGDEPVEVRGGVLGSADKCGEFMRLLMGQKRWLGKEGFRGRREAKTNVALEHDFPAFDLLVLKACRNRRCRQLNLQRERGGGEGVEE